jgi:hypothetical protein
LDPWWPPVRVPVAGKLPRLAHRASLGPPSTSTRHRFPLTPTAKSTRIRGGIPLNTFTADIDDDFGSVDGHLDRIPCRSLLAKKPLHPSLACFYDRSGNFSSRLRCLAQGIRRALKSQAYDFSCLVGFHSPTGQLAGDVAAGDHCEHGLASYPQGQIARARELRRRHLSLLASQDPGCFRLVSGRGSARSLVDGGAEQVPDTVGEGQAERPAHDHPQDGAADVAAA